MDKSQSSNLNLEEKIALSESRHAQMLAAVRQFPSIDALPDPIKDQMAQLDYNDDRRKKILVIYYGGTLGMKSQRVDGEDALVPSNHTDRLLMPLKERGLEERMQLVWLPALDKPIDSTNARWPHWVSIANAIEMLYDNFDGFVVAGGTDTMDYLLAALGFIFPNIGKPIIGAAAQQPMYDWGEDAVRNLPFSLQAACEDISGVHLAFYDVLRDGRHIFKVKDRGYAAFDCPEQNKTGYYEQGEVILYGNVTRRQTYVSRKNLIVNKQFRDGINLVHINPFQSAKSLLHEASDPNSVAILLTTYGAGNVRHLELFEGDGNHVDVLRILHEMQYPVVLGSPMQDGRVNSPYESGVKAINAGVISGGNTTGSALPVKMSRALALSWEVGKGIDYLEFRRQMYKNHIGEFDDRIKDKMLKAA